MFNVVNYYRLGHWFYMHRIPVFPVLINYFIRFVFSAWIPASATIGRHVRFGYGGLGVVVHGKAIIGDHVLIAQNVTIAGKNNGVPRIEDYVYIGAGAKVLGGVTVGSYSIIGANAVVVKDVPPRSMVGGVPARVLRENITLSDYEHI